MRDVDDRYIVATGQPVHARAMEHLPPGAPGWPDGTRLVEAADE